MADLSTLDATQPDSTAAVSLGDDAIRETRSALLTSFGGTDAGSGTQTSEHYLKGFHKFPSGNSAARPAAGNAGRLYINTGYSLLERDTGSTWAVCNAVAIDGITAGAVDVTNVETLCAAVSSLVVPSGGRVLLSARLYAAVPSVTSVVTGRLYRDSTQLDELTALVTAVTPLRLVFDLYADDAVTAGTYTYSLKASLSTVATQAMIGKLTALIV